MGIACKSLKIRARRMIEIIELFVFARYIMKADGRQLFWFSVSNELCDVQSRTIITQINSEIIE